jgi:hypothetical protein
MPTKEEYQKHKEYYKEYREKNKEHLTEYRKEWYENNKEHRKEYDKKYSKEWYKNNKEHKTQYNKEYKQTDAGKKTHLISRWKQTGLICDNIEELYEHYINTFECDNCGIELVTGNYGANKRCLDHCHITGKFRNILCNTCNVERGKDDNSIK